MINYIVSFFKCELFIFTFGSWSHSFLLSLIPSMGEGNGNPLQYSCLENPMGRGAWYAALYGVAKNQTWLSDFTFTFHFHALEKDMATHSSVLAWRIPGIGEPGGLLSVGSHRVRHDWSNLAAAAFLPWLVLTFSCGLVVTRRALRHNWRFHNCPVIYWQSTSPKHHLEKLHFVHIMSYLCTSSMSMVFTGGSDGKESACNEGEPGFNPWQEDPLEKEMATYSSILA